MDFLCDPVSQKPILFNIDFMTDRFTRIIIAVVFLLTGISVPAKAEIPCQIVKTDPLQVRIHTLENGMKVYLAVNNNTPRIQTYIAFRVGSKHDPAETTGLAHYFEHMMFKGTTLFGTSDWESEKPLINAIEELFELYRQTTDSHERASIYRLIDSLSFEASKFAIANEYSRLMNAIGSTGTNAATSYDYTYYIENIPANQLENWTRIQFERFRQPVLRLFHTELEAVYEEKNMSLTNDMRMVTEAMYKGLFPHHPYGLQTTLGEPEHLKNPSMKNIRLFFDDYYVPENMAVVLSGDFDPDEAIEVINRYFGQMQPGRAIALETKAEKPVDGPVVLEVTGQQSEMVQIGWRFGGAGSDDALYIDLISGILFNGRAGIIDRNLNQPMLTRVAGASTTNLADYSIISLMGRNKPGQSLEEVHDLLIEQIESLKRGEFPDWLIEAAVNNQKSTRARRMESIHNVARDIAQAFMMDIDWENHVSYLDRLGRISRQDIIDFANEHFHDNYVVVYKRQGTPEGIELVDKPPISPIHINRDLESEFFRSIVADQVDETEPVFVDFQQSIHVNKQEGKPGYLVVSNHYLPTFSLTFNYNLGSMHDPRFAYAASLLRFLSTHDQTADQINEGFYRLATNLSMSVRRDNIRISLRGLSHNLEESLSMLENLVWNAVPDDEVLAGRINQAKTTRLANKNNQQALLTAMEHYALFGERNPSTLDLSDQELDQLTAGVLIDLIRSLWSIQHDVLYHGPHSLDEVMHITRQYRYIPDTLYHPADVDYIKARKQEKDEVYFVHFEANQSYLMTVARGAAYDFELAILASLYNRYFGSGMQSIVFQELREKRGLAYAARASYEAPVHPDGYFIHSSYIATQNDKVIEAFSAFNELFDEVPLSETAFRLSKEQMLSNIRTERLSGDQLISTYLGNLRMGHTEDIRKEQFNGIASITIGNIEAFSNNFIRNKPKAYLILGHRDHIDFEAVEQLFGPVKELDRDQLFVY